MGCVKLHILDQQYKKPELRVSCHNKKLTSKNSVLNPCSFLYHLRDHLGSVRVAFEPTTSGNEVRQINAYYPFGAPIAALSWSSQHSNPNRYKHTGMETIEDFGLGYVDNGARWRGSPFAPGFRTRDPLAAKYPHLSPYIYCGNNPVNRIDPDGRADFWVNGKVIGNDGVDDQRILVLKTTEKSFESSTDKVAGAGLSKADHKATVDFITANSGNAEAFQNNGIAYTNSIAIESSADNRQAMVNEVSRDNGKGGTADANNREYGGSIQNGSVVVAPAGAVSNPATQANASIELPAGVPTFHSHPSGNVVVAPPTGTIGGTTTTSSFNQFPSSIDVGGAGGNTHYVFGRGDGKVYVYTSGVVQAVIPMKQFVNPKR